MNLRSLASALSLAILTFAARALAAADYCLSPIPAASPCQS